MRICIYGAGAIGGFLGAMLAEAGHEVSLVARGAHLAALRANGLTLEIGGRTLRSRPPASDDPGDLGVQDHVIVSVKSPALPSVARGIAPLLGPETTIVTAINGVPWWFFHGAGGAHEGRALRSIDPDGALARSLDARRIVGCVVHAGCSVPAPGVIRHASGDRFIIGEPGGSVTARVRQLGEALTGAGLSCEVSPRIRQEVWMKYLGNMSMGPISLLTGTTLLGIARDPEARQVCAGLMAEAIAVGRAFGLEPGMTIDERIALGAQLGDFKPSMLQDLEKGRPVELDTFLDVALEMAEIAGIAVPVIATVRGLAVNKARLAGLYPAA